MQQALHFAADTNRREPVENGVANLEIFISKVFEKISQYRYHEVNSPVPTSIFLLTLSPPPAVLPSLSAH
jgi:hypothetical protein